MSNHFHILVQIYPGDHFSDKEIMKRCKAHYGKDFTLSVKQISYYRNKLSNLSDYMKEIKQSFSWYYNKLHNRRGTLWGERYKSLIVENGETLVNCLAYIDLNPVRAGIVKKPEDYRWCSIGYHVQSGNKDGFLSLDFGLKEFGLKDESEMLRLYRKFTYEKGHIEARRFSYRHTWTQPDMVDRFKYRTRYFIDSGIIGTKAFVATHYQAFKQLFSCKHEKRPKAVKGLNGIYSLKRLSEKS